MTAVQRSRRMTVEEAWRTRQRDGSPEPQLDGSPRDTEAGPSEPVIGESGRGTGVDTAPRPEPVITAASGAGAGSEAPAGAGEASAATTPTVVEPLLDGAVPPSPDGPDPGRSAPEHPSGGAGAADTSGLITSSGPAAAPATAARPRSPITAALPRPELRPPARPRIEPEPAILGLTRHMRSRLGSRLFNLFFTFVFVLILVQMVVALLTP